MLAFVICTTACGDNLHLRSDATPPQSGDAAIDVAIDGAIA